MDFVLYDFPAANAGDTIRVDIDAAANVQLVDDQNFGAYRRGGQYEYWGGHYQRTPVFLKVPRYGNWHIVKISPGEVEQFALAQPSSVGDGRARR